MLLYFAIFVVGAIVGAAILDQVIRHKHGKSYSKWIKDDFALQWSLIKDITYSHHFSPFSENIQKLSPQFCTLHAEAAVAERASLPQLAGLAYGKALECLIKDYAKVENPGKDPEIEASPLAACVKNYIHDDLVKNSAELGAWLRNDQMHYVRRHEEHGIDELKALNQLIVSLIEENDRRKSFASTVDTLRKDLNAKKS
ncbi:MAG: hypothetical protein JNL64_11170 [Blastocatellia bacterium]|nr:hypothetical protein [Blastocatellia bacterium]